MCYWHLVQYSDPLRGIVSVRFVSRHEMYFEMIGIVLPSWSRYILAISLFFSVIDDRLSSTYNDVRHCSPVQFANLQFLPFFIAIFLLLSWGPIPEVSFPLIKMQWQIIKLSLAFSLPSSLLIDTIYCSSKRKRLLFQGRKNPDSRGGGRLGNLLIWTLSLLGLCKISAVR